MQLWKRILSVACVLFTLAYVPYRALADDVYATIHGTVTDPAGAVVPGATVTATNTSTGVSKTVTTSSSGNFQIPDLTIGPYSVKVEKDGFKTYEASGFTLVLNEDYSLPIKMTIGGTSEILQVRADTVQVETSDSQLKSLIPGTTIVDLPLNGRNWTTLVQLTPGAQASSDRFGTSSINGSQSNQSTFLINGTDSNDITLNTPLFIPSPDALAEFNVISDTMNAEYGRNSGAMINTVYKSGTNSFHGTAFEFYRDTFLNTKNYFTTAAPQFHRNQFGAEIGGPILKDKLFGMFSYQGTRSVSPQQPSFQQTVFSPAQLAGQFADAGAGANKSPFALTGCGGQQYPAGTPYSTIFACGKVPTSDFNPISAKLTKQFVPAANVAGTNFFQYTPISVSSQDQYIYRIDYALSQKDALYTVGFFDHLPSTNPLSFFGGSLPGFGEIDGPTTKQFIVDDVHTFNQNLLNEIRISYSRQNYLAVVPQTPVNPATYGFGINPQSGPGQAGLPYMNIQGYFSLGFSQDGPQPRKVQNYELNDNLSYLHGNHSFKFGFTGTRFSVDNPFYFDNNGAYQFQGLGTYSTGDPALDFLLGIPDTYAQNSGGVINTRAYELYPYAQDSFKAMDNLTLNYGLGWQIDTPLNNNQFGGKAVTCFTPGEQSIVSPNAPTGYNLPGDPGCTRSGGYTTKRMHFAPRFGFAWAPDLGGFSGGDQKKLSIRGGFGVFFNRDQEEMTLQNLGAPPFGLSSQGAASFGGSPSFANPYADIASNKVVANPYPFVPPTASQLKSYSAAQWASFFPAFLFSFDPNYTVPYSYNFNLNVQRELPGNQVLQLSYVGSVGHKLDIAHEANPITPAGHAACLADPTCAGPVGQQQQQLNYPTHTIAPGNIFLSVGRVSSWGASNYNSFQASLSRNLGNIFYQLSYTYSHALDNASGYESSSGANNSVYNEFPGYTYLSYGDSDYDARHRFIASYVYQIPIPGSWQANGLLRRAAGGFHISGITTFATGFPANFIDSNHHSLWCSAFTFFGCPDIPVTSNFKFGHFNARKKTAYNNYAGGSAGNFFFNPTYFTPEPVGTFGNAKRGFFHGPGILNTDMAILKDVAVTKSTYVEMRLETFNTFNHTQFSNPDTQLLDQSTTFGQVTSVAPQAQGRITQLSGKFYF